MTINTNTYIVVTTSKPSATAKHSSAQTVESVSLLGAKRKANKILGNSNKNVFIFNASGDLLSARNSWDSTGKYSDVLTSDKVLDIDILESELAVLENNLSEMEFLATFNNVAEYVENEILGKAIAIAASKYNLEYVELEDFNNYLLAESIISSFLSRVKSIIDRKLYVTKQDGNIILSNSLLDFIDSKSTKKQIELSIKDNGYLLEDGQKVGIFDFLEIIKNNYGDIGFNLSMLASGIYQDYKVNAVTDNAPESKFTNALDNDNYFLLLPELPLLALCNSEGCNSFIVMNNDIFDIEVIAHGESLAPGSVSFLVSPYISKYEARELIGEIIELYSSLPDDPCDKAMKLQDIKYTILDRSYSIALE